VRDHLDTDLSTIQANDDDDSDEASILLSARIPCATAVIVNVNAGGVNDRIIDMAREIFSEEHVYVTSNPIEAAQAAAQILQPSRNNNNTNHHPYRIVVPIGGDGTLTTTINDMVQILQQQPQSPTTTKTTMTTAEALRLLPDIAYIPLGTGNGVGSIVGCRLPEKKQSSFSIRRPWQFFRKKRKLAELRNVLQAIRNAATTDRPLYQTIPLPVIQVTAQNLDIQDDDSNDDDDDDDTGNRKKMIQELCFFVGVGFDSLMLNDFKEIKAWSQSRSGLLHRILSSVAGYCVALVVKTLPKAMRGHHNIHVTVQSLDNNNDDGDDINHDSTAKSSTSTNSEMTTSSTLWVDHRRGDFARPLLPTNRTLCFHGSTGILAAGTCPYYGGGLRLFPFARLYTDKMHLRLGRIHPMTGFFNIPGIFAGSYRDTSDEEFGVLDFLGTGFDVEIHEGFPLQHSGEAVGHVDHFCMRVIQEPVRFVDFLPNL
jgi:diacylglycerol kinase family enzyme